MTFLEILEKSNMNLKEFGEYFEIPYRTLQNWKSGTRSCPEYMLKLMEYKLENEEEDKVMMLKRVEFLGDKNGREYMVSTEDERKVEQLRDKFFSEHDRENALDNALDSFEDGYNELKVIDGELFEVFENLDFRITRKAYI